MSKKVKIDSKVKKCEIDNKSTEINEEDTTFFKIPQKRRVGRPLTANSGFNVTIHKTSNKYRYLSIQRKKNVHGKNIFCHYHLGVLNKQNEFIPSNKYIFSPLSFRKKLIFPKEVKMNVVEDLERMYNENRNFFDKFDKSVEKEKVLEKELELV